MNKTLKVLFYLKPPKKYESGPMPIYMRLTVDGKRIEISTQRECDPDKWDGKACRVLGLKRELNRQLNNYLDALQGKIFEVQRELQINGIEVTAENIRDFLRGKLKDDEPTITLLEVYRNHVEEVKALVGKEYALGTLKRFRSALSSLEAFIKHKEKDDVLLQDLKYQFITEYEFFLKSERHLEHNTAMGNIKKLKKIVRQCVANDLMEKDPFMTYKVKIRDTNRPFLLQNELDRIIALEILSDRLAQVRDIFVFCCYTGLAYSDVQKLSRLDIVLGDDGEQWIHTERVKTETATRIPILPASDGNSRTL